MSNYEDKGQQHDDEEREMPFESLSVDDVTPQEYRRAIDTLRDVLEVKPEDIKTVEDLSAHVSLVGEELRKVVHASGKIETTNFEYLKPGSTKETKAVDRTYAIREPIGDHKIFSMSSDRGVSIINAYKIKPTGEQHSLYLVEVPLTEIRIIEDPILNMETYAVDWRSGKAVSYYPTKEPFNAEVQQGFLRVLQDGISEILDVIQEPES